MAAPPPIGAERRYSGKVTSIIILAIVALFVLLNLVAGRLIPRPDTPVPRPVVTTRSTSSG